MVRIAISLGREPQDSSCRIGKLRSSESAACFRCFAASGFVASSHLGLAPNATYFMVSRVVFGGSFFGVTFGTWLFSVGGGEPSAVKFAGLGGLVACGPQHL